MISYHRSSSQRRLLTHIIARGCHRSRELTSDLFLAHFPLEHGRDRAGEAGICISLDEWSVAVAFPDATSKAALSTIREGNEIGERGSVGVSVAG